MASQRNPQKKLRVTFADGTSVCYNRAVQTMIAALNRIGADRFPEITLELCHRPLVSQEVYPELKNYMKEICPGWYLITQSDTDTKLLQLREISRLLNLDMTVESGIDFEITDESEKGLIKRPKKRLRVTFDDGVIINSDNYRDTFMECICKLDPNRLAQRQIQWQSKPLITATQQTSYQRKIADYRWLTIPNTTKEAAKLLNFISIHLDAKLIVEVE